MSGELTLPNTQSGRCQENSAIEIVAPNSNRAGVTPETTLESFLEGIRFLKNLEPQGGSFLAKAGLFAASALAAGVSLSRSLMSFGDVKVNHSKNKSFNINNNSDCPVNLSLMAPVNFSVNPSQVTVPAKGSRYVTVTFTPSQEGNFSGHISISPGVTNVAVSGKGVK